MTLVALALFLAQSIPFPGPGGVAIPGTPPPAFIANESTCAANFSGSLTCTMPLTPTSGNCLVLGFGARVNTGTPAQITALTTTNVTWVNVAAGNDGSNNSIATWIGKVAASAGTAVSISFGSGNNAAGTVVVREATGIPACNASSVDATAVIANGSSTTAAIGAYTTTFANDMVYVLARLKTSACAQFSTQPSGYTALTCKEISASDALQPDYLQTGAGSQTASWTLGGSNVWLTSVVALKGN